MQTIISIISLIISLIAIALSYYLFRKTRRANIMPVLVFSRISEKSWQLKNVGRGPALSIVVGERKKNDKWIPRVSFYPIAAGAAIEIPWFCQGDEFAATYADIEGKAYSTFCSMSDNRFFGKNRFPDLKPMLDEISWKAHQEEYRRMF